MSLLNDCAVLIPSCDSYGDLWKPFFTLFWKFWPDCPFPVYLGSNEHTFVHPRVNMLHAGHGNNWTRRVSQQLEALQTTYVLLCLEDFFLRAPVRTDEVVRCLDVLRALGGHMLRLVPNPGPDRSIRDWPDIGLIESGAPYRLSTQAALWKRSSLLSFMRSDESIWEFEINGSRRTDHLLDGFLCVSKAVLPYAHHVVERGRWFRFEAKRFGALGIGCDFNTRPVMTIRQATVWHYWKLRSLCLNAIPWKRRLALKRFVYSVDGLGLVGRLARSSRHQNRS